MRILHYLVLLTTIAVSLLAVSCKKTDLSGENTPTITVDPSSLNIAKNLAIGHRLTVQANNVLLPAAELRWSSENTQVATVTDQGVVTGTGEGETNIIATLINGKGAGKCRVTVYDESAYKFRLVLKDKGTSDFLISEPEKFLSARAVARRKKRNIAVNETDLPISVDYISQVRKIGGVIVAQSKWLNTITVFCNSGLLMDEYKKLPFVKEVLTVWEGKKGITPSMLYTDSAFQKTGVAPVSTAKDSFYYGSAWQNIHVNNGEVLHGKGYEGGGIDIAVIDAGFKDLKTNSSLDNINIKGARSFIFEDANPFNTDDHGVWVTSCMATNKPGYYVGTAPGANYWLLRTEDESSEYAVEEDYWVAAAEYADSAGVDMVNTSLYYTSHDGLIRYKYEDMNGKTAFASRGANMAVDKGIFIVCCAGNDQSWVGTPGEAADVLTTGSINRTGNIDNFTSYGITIDGRIKPDVVALGGLASVIDINGKPMSRSGTSYASPIVCGLAACLWQAYPKLTNKDLLDIFRKASNRYGNPVVPYGYGIPDMNKAMQLAQTVSASK